MRTVVTTTILILSIQFASSQSNKPIYTDITIGKSSVVDFDLSKEFGYSISISKSLFSVTERFSMGVGFNFNEFRHSRSWESETSTAFNVWENKSRFNTIGLVPKGIVKLDNYHFEVGIEIGYIFSSGEKNTLRESIEKEVDPNSGGQIVTETGMPIFDVYVGGTVKRKRLIYPLNFLASRKVSISNQDLFVGLKGYYSVFNFDNAFNTYLIGMNVMYEF